MLFDPPVPITWWQCSRGTFHRKHQASIPFQALCALITNPRQPARETAQSDAPRPASMPLPMRHVELWRHRLQPMCQKMPPRTTSSRFTQVQEAPPHSTMEELCTSELAPFSIHSLLDVAQRAQKSTCPNKVPQCRFRAASLTLADTEARQSRRLARDSSQRDKVQSKAT